MQIKVRMIVTTFRLSSHIALHLDADVLRYFLYGMGHKKLDISLTNEKLESAMYTEMYERKIQCPQLQKTIHLAASLIEVG
jgi:hypothetical protein